MSRPQYWDEIGHLRKSGRQALVLFARPYDGSYEFDLRAYTTRGRVPRPTRRAVVFRAEVLRELIELLQRAEAGVAAPEDVTAEEGVENGA